MTDSGNLSALLPATLKVAEQLVFTATIRQCQLHTDSNHFIKLTGGDDND